MAGVCGLEGAFEGCAGFVAGFAAGFADLVAEFAEELAAGFAGVGSLQAVVFKETSGSPNGRVYKYLMRFDQGNVLATFTLNSAGRISGIDLSG